MDCAGTYYGDLELDDCGVCDGNGFSCHSVTLAFGEVTSESAEILYSSSVNIGGFQFDTDGVELTGVLSDFSDISYSAETGIALGFSLAGDSLPAGDGILATLNFVPMVLGGTLSMSELSISSENAVEVPSTTPESVDIPGMLASLSLGAFDSSGTLEVLYDFDGPVAGFQFDVTGLALTGGSGGAADDAGFDITAGGTTVIGFSMTGDTIPSGSGLLTTLSFSDILSDTTELSLGNFGAITDSDLNAYNVSLEGLIEHPMDCAGTYYGDLVVDDCGICGGDGFSCVNVVLSFGEVTDQSAEILYSSPVDIGGFQFDTDGVEPVSYTHLTLPTT